MKYILVIILLLTSINYSQVDRTSPPKPGPAPEIKLGSFDSFTLKNGLRVFVVKNDKLPVISVSLSLDYDPVLEGNKSGYISAAGMLLRTGTKNRTKDMLDNDIDRIGASVSTSSSGIYGYALKKHADKLFEIVSDITINARFTETELAKIKQLMLSNLAASKEEPDAIAGKVVNKLFYGEGHPYAEYETEESVEAFTLQDCINFYNSFFRPQIGYMAIVGSVTTDEAKVLANKYFAAWEKKNVPAAKYTAPKSPKGIQIAIVDRPNAVQTNIVVGHPITLTMNHPDVIKARVTNTILGGGVFRLFLNLREKHGWTYGAYSSLNNDPLTGSFSAYANVRNEVTDSAITEMLFEMKRISAETVEDHELQLVKNYLSGSFALSLESPQTIANFAINTEKYKLDKNYFRNYLKSIAAVTSADIKKTAPKYIQPDYCYIVLVGNAAEIAPKVASLSADPIVYYDETGNRVTETIPPPDQGELTPEKILENYINAIGGKENLLKVKDKSVMMQTKFQNFDISAMVYHKLPNKMMQKFSFGGMEQAIMFDGERGYQKSVMGDEELTGDNLEMIRFEAGLHNILYLDKFGIKASYKGTEKVKGKDAHKVELLFKTGAVMKYYYDTQTWLRIREERMVESPQGKINQTTDLDDYREVEGVKYPYSIKQAAGGMNLEFKVSVISINQNLQDSLFIFEEK